MRLINHEGKVILKRMVNNVEDAYWQKIEPGGAVEREAKILFEIEQYLNDEVDKEIFRRWRTSLRVHL